MDAEIDTKYRFLLRYSIQDVGFSPSVSLSLWNAARSRLRVGNTWTRWTFFGSEPSHNNTAAAEEENHGMHPHLLFRCSSP